MKTKLWFKLRYTESSASKMLRQPSGCLEMRPRLGASSMSRRYRPLDICYQCALACTDAKGSPAEPCRQWAPSLNAKCICQRRVPESHHVDRNAPRARWHSRKKPPPLYARAFYRFYCTDACLRVSCARATDAAADGLPPNNNFREKMFHVDVFFILIRQQTSIRPP